jgi:hypothetical protein
MKLALAKFRLSYLGKARSGEVVLWKSFQEIERTRESPTMIVSDFGASALFIISARLLPLTRDEAAAR